MNATSPWFGPEDQAALDDVWSVVDARFDELQAERAHAAAEQAELLPLAASLSATAIDGAGKSAREALRRAIGGAWADYDARIRAEGADFAKSGVTFRAFYDLARAWHRRLLPFLVEAYGATPARMTAAIVVAEELEERAMAARAEAYLDGYRSLFAGARHQMRASEERYRLLFDASPLPMWVYDVDTLAFLAVNDAAIRHYGYSRDELAKMTLADIRPPEDVEALREDVEHRPEIDLGKTWRHQKKDGSLIVVEIKAHDLPFDGKSARLVLANDVTERTRAEEALRRTEDQLRQMQKLDAIGRLAGGVAHDFNNLLSVILSYSTMLVAQLGPGDAMRADLDEIIAAGERAADLTRQLLAFGRQQMLQPKIIQPADVVAGMEKMLRRLIGEDIELTILSRPRLGCVNVDPGQLEQIVLNLVINARDAMPRGGKLTLEWKNTEIDEAYAKDHVGAPPGPYVVLAVTDSGMGMDRATQARIFEPFFTTKERGKGTGLGLSTVFGIVKQSGGSIWLYSEPGHGTTFKIYLPRAAARSDASAPLDDASPISTASTLIGSETVLLVEDEERVRGLVRTILRKYGYHVIEAQNGGDALLLCEQHAATIHLLLTDVVMPRMSGRQLAERLRPLRPAMKVLYMSGYTSDSIVHHGVLDSDIAFVQKPIRPEALVRKVREVLDARPRDPHCV
jgi:two-component system cell cycle sensor histidine kinase/response regulator CckA